MEELNGFNIMNDNSKEFSEFFAFNQNVPLFSIITYDNPNSTKILTKIKKYFSKSISNDLSETNNLENNFFTLKNVKISNVSHFYKDFILDRMGMCEKIDEINKKSKTKTSNDKTSNNSEFSYKLDSKIVLTDSSCEVLKNNKECFNCSSTEHSLSACPFPKNMALINEKRREFLKSVGVNKFVPNVRYHADEDVKPPKFVPGQISEDLRKALNCQKNELPPYIYQMRVLGYPPGYSLQSYLNSQVTVFGSNDSAQMQNLSAKMVYDIKYPGFNAPIPPGFVDTSKEQGYPKINPSLFIGEPEIVHAQPKKVVPEIIDTTIITRGFYLDPLILNTYPVSKFWRGPPSLSETVNFELIAKIIENPINVNDDPFSDEVIPTKRFSKILKFLKEGNSKE